jgi:hypothetical protein
MGSSSNLHATAKSSAPSAMAWVVGSGQFIEASYFVFDKHDNIYVGDTGVGRITEMVAPKK